MPRLMLAPLGPPGGDDSFLDQIVESVCWLYCSGDSRGAA